MEHKIAFGVGPGAITYKHDIALITIILAYVPAKSCKDHNI